MAEVRRARSRPGSRAGSSLRLAARRSFVVDRRRGRRQPEPGVQQAQQPLTRRHSAPGMTLAERVQLYHQRAVAKGAAVAASKAVRRALRRGRAQAVAIISASPAHLAALATRAADAATAATAAALTGFPPSESGESGAESGEASSPAPSPTWNVSARPEPLALLNPTGVRTAKDSPSRDSNNGGEGVITQNTAPTATPPLLARASSLDAGSPSRSCPSLSPPSSARRHRMLFLWTKGGNKVELIGSFTDWSAKPLRMHWLLGVHVCLVQVPAGEHKFKFVVDGDWQHDERLPAQPVDGLPGSWDNVVTVEDGDQVVADAASWAKLGLPRSVQEWETLIRFTVSDAASPDELDVPDPLRRRRSLSLPDASLASPDQRHQPPQQQQQQQPHPLRNPPQEFQSPQARAGSFTERPGAFSSPRRSWNKARSAGERSRLREAIRSAHQSPALQRDEEGNYLRAPVAPVRETKSAPASPRRQWRVTAELKQSVLHSLQSKSVADRTLPSRPYRPGKGSPERPGQARDGEGGLAWIPVDLSTPPSTRANANANANAGSGPDQPKTSPPRHSQCCPRPRRSGRRQPQPRRAGKGQSGRDGEQDGEEQKAGGKQSAKTNPVQMREDFRAWRTWTAKSKGDPALDAPPATPFDPDADPAQFRLAPGPGTPGQASCFILNKTTPPTPADVLSQGGVVWLQDINASFDVVPRAAAPGPSRRHHHRKP